MRHVYLDYNATTPLAPQVAAAMRSLMDLDYGNPSSRHWAGERARVEAAANRLMGIADLERAIGGSLNEVSR